MLLITYLCQKEVSECQNILLRLDLVGCVLSAMTRWGASKQSGATRLIIIKYTVVLITSWRF